jgi:hypothetical protein
VGPARHTPFCAHVASPLLRCVCGPTPSATFFPKRRAPLTSQRTPLPACATNGARSSRGSDQPFPPPNRRGVRNPHGRRAIKSRSQPFNPHRCSNQREKASSRRRRLRLCRRSKSARMVGGVRREPVKLPVPSTRAKHPWCLGNFSPKLRHHHRAALRRHRVPLRHHRPV